MRILLIVCKMVIASTLVGVMLAFGLSITTPTEASKLGNERGFSFVIECATDEEILEQEDAAASNDTGYVSQLQVVIDRGSVVQAQLLELKSEAEAKAKVEAEAKAAAEAEASNTSKQSVVSQSSNSSPNTTSSPNSNSSSSMSPNTLRISGSTVSYYIDLWGNTPDSGASLWAGSDSTTDGSYGYFIGHNPGSFNCVAQLNVGDKVTVCDSSGNAKTYTVVNIFSVSREGRWSDVSPSVTGRGESVSFQTCMGEGKPMRVVVCDA